ncbi:hypothetical protein U14_01919 [Candidatus Moduliflexus flocculans]|uniref:Uncharacterized protein n=1 Tax=Candidatus Moduliflexus flocculans TaxID=1499966 RepID=A0A0S6VZM1_9BACT|nr:hypothetical protein U14_01919 [Candidatus Moduliflexus flocculans]
MTRKKKKDEGGSSGIILLLLIFVFSPGMLVMSLIKVAFNLTLDGGQMWTFAVIISILLFGTLCGIFKDMAKAAVYYFSTSGIIVVVFLLCHFGLKLTFPVNFLDNFF